MVKLTNLAKNDAESFSDFYTRRAYDYLLNMMKNSLKERYGKQIIIEYDDNIKFAVFNWIKKYDPKYDKRSKKSSRNELYNVSYFIKLDKRTFCYVNFGQHRRYNRNSDFNDFFSMNESKDYIYIFGRNYKKYYSELEYNIKNNITSDDNSKLSLFTVDGSMSSDGKENISVSLQDLSDRSIDTLFYEEGVKEKIISHIDSFYKNADIYKERNLNYKTGILLYGKPGTGKSSLALALANKYRCNICLVNINTFDKCNIVELSTAINNDNSRYIVLLEDIDTLYSLNRDDAKIDEKKIINKLLQFLDSNISPKNVIFIATTNNIDILDEAIKRDGRFDLKIAINEIDKDVARKMIMSFDISKTEANKMIDKIDSKTVNQSKLQNEILRYFKKNILFNNNQEVNEDEISCEEA